MWMYVGRRVLQFAPVLLLATVAVFSMVHLVPGDPAVVYVGPDATPERLEAVREEFGLNRPLPVQYVDWVTSAIRGDLGNSYHSGHSVSGLIMNRFPATLQLAVASMIVGLFLGIPLGVMAGLERGKNWGRISSVFSSVTLAVPTYWVGILFILFFAVQLDLVPTSASYVRFWEDPVKAAINLAGPSLALGTLVAGIVARFVRSSVADIAARDYIQAARARGLPERTVIWKHILRNAAIPTITIIGIEFGTFLGGTVIVESVFNYPGLGRLVISGLSSRDFVIVQGGILFSVVVLMLVTLVVDVLYALLNPRIRLR